MVSERKPGVRPDPRRNGKWQVRFRLGGTQYTKTVATEREANRRVEGIEDRKKLLKAGTQTLPGDVDVGEWLWTGQQVKIKPHGQEDAGPTAWRQFRDRYEKEVVPGLAKRTADKIGTVFNAVEKALPRVAGGKLADLNPEAISRFQAVLRNGKRSENTIAGYLAHLRAALAWAHELDLITTLPKIKRPQRAKKGGGGSKSKGRPITAEEFDRLLDKIPAALVETRHRKRATDRQTRVNKKQHVRAVGAPIPVEITPATVESWRHYLTGLWLSGLRLTESLDFYWDRRDGLRVELGGRRPMISIPAESEKGHRDRLLPITPDFAELLLRTPKTDRRGPVFRPLRLSGNRATATQAGRMVALMGELAGVVVNTDPRTGKTKFASAHDLRRSFGNRWAKRVMPAVLQRLMRHESIATTMGYYVDLDADELAEDLYRDHGQAAAPTAASSSAGGKPRKRRIS